jgi:endonuclease/exonuclease/phosphatase (EEP) superfamily protein YafD
MIEEEKRDAAGNGALFRAVFQSSLVKHWDFFGAIAAAVFAVLFFIIRLTVRDDVPIIAALYYASPWAIIFFMATFSGSVFYRYGRIRLAVVFTTLAILSCFGWYLTCFGNHRVRSPQGRAHRVVFWNMGYKMFQRPGMAGELSRLNADIVAVAEAPGNTRKLQRYAEQQFPGYECATRFHGLWLMCKGEIVSDHEEKICDTARLKTMHIRLRDQEVRVVILDLDSHPFADRRRPMAEVAARTKQWSDMPTLLVGDFNTPIDSNHVGLLRNELTHASTDVGQGYLPTWPAHFPIMQIDHILGNDKIKFLQAKAAWTWRSDHRPLVVDFEMDGRLDFAATW